MTIKRIITILLSFLICSFFVSCNNNDLNENTINNQTNIVNHQEVIEVDNLKSVLYEKVKSEILKWNEKEIYAI